MFTLFRRKNKKIVTDKKKIDEILNRGVEDVFVRKELEKKLLSGRQLRVKLGFDPTGGKIHIGRAIILRKLRDFQKLGHQVIFIVGDFTVLIGDPSDKLEKRPVLSVDQIKANLKNYKDQVGRIIDLNTSEFYFNSKWLPKLTFKEISELAESFTVQQMSNRRNFKERLNSGQDVSLREFLYPLMQGYDSVEVRADVEIGGFDQLFNLKAGRVIQKHFRQPEQDILTTKMLEGTDGRKMSTSWGNVINITDEPNDMYGKIMSMKDELLPQYFLLCTDLSEQEIDQAINGVHPKEAKMRLAREIVSIYHSKDLAEKAEKNFVDAFSKGNVPEDIQEIVVPMNSPLVNVAIQNKIISSKSEFKRLAQEGGIKDLETDKIINDFNYIVSTDKSILFGKKKFLKISIKK